MTKAMEETLGRGQLAANYFTHPELVALTPSERVSWARFARRSLAITHFWSYATRPVTPLEHERTEQRLAFIDSIIDNEGALT